ncbi:MAG: 16S rRNA (cytidine(1402)-2'-O)-methyltransferase [Balneolaceae bacterium]
MSTLYIVATPIGNLSDFSTRAIQTLQRVDRIGCEDTRTSSVLLNEYKIDKPLFSFHLHNEHHKVKHLVNLLDAGEQIALISDAGMPGISDPGFLAVRAAHQNGHTVSAIPGPDAATTALAASGLPSDRYVYEGFLPPKKGRETRIRQIADSEITSVVYVSPHKLIRFLNRLSEFTEPTRWICIARELTKKFEEIQRGQLQSMLVEWEQRETVKGEFVVIISGKNYSE